MKDTWPRPNSFLLLMLQSTVGRILWSMLLIRHFCRLDGWLPERCREIPALKVFWFMFEVHHRDWEPVEGGIRVLREGKVVCRVCCLWSGLSHCKYLEMAARLRKLLQIMWQSVHFDIMALNKYLILTKFGALVISDHEERRTVFVIWWPVCLLQLWHNHPQRWKQSRCCNWNIKKIYMRELLFVPLEFSGKNLQYNASVSINNSKLMKITFQVHSTSIEQWNWHKTD